MMKLKLEQFIQDKKAARRLKTHEKAKLQVVVKTFLKRLPNIVYAEPVQHEEELRDIIPQSSRT